MYNIHTACFDYEYLNQTTGGNSQNLASRAQSRAVVLNECHPALIPWSISGLKISNPTQCPDLSWAAPQRQIAHPCLLYPTDR